MINMIIAAAICKTDSICAFPLNMKIMSVLLFKEKQNE